MRAIVVAFALTIGISGAVSSQAPTQRTSSLIVNITEGRSRAFLAAVTIPYATGGPWASVPSRPQGLESPTVSSFRIRAWAEGTGARVIVFAVAPRPDETETETQIAAIALAPGESQEITATEKYNARPVTITVSTGQ